VLREWFGFTKRTRPEKPAAGPVVSSTETVLGIGSAFEGTLKCEGNVRLDGYFKGNISARGKVTLGERGKLEGDLLCESAAVAGVLRGDITARKVSILRTGRIWGNLQIETLVTEEGGFIQGLITMQETVKLAELLPPAEAAESTASVEGGKKAEAETAIVEKTSKLSSEAKGKNI
jgi:cytoskeletal protein CcmA (bactofilin family)